MSSEKFTTLQVAWKGDAAEQEANEREQREDMVGRSHYG